MAQLFNIVDDKVVINKLALKYLEGTVVHAGTLDIVGNTSIQANLFVKGELTADTLKVKKLVTEEGINPTEPGNWTASTEEELNGKGFNWEHPNRTAKLAYRTGGRIWANSSIDIDRNCSYKIDNLPILSANELGASVVKSNLREVGALGSLTVTGNATVGDFAFFNSAFGKLGLGTDEPSSAITIVENDVELKIGSPKYGVATIGTGSCHDFAILSDNIPRIVVKNTGEVIIGDEIGKSGTLKVYGELYAEKIVSDIRIERTSSLEFKTTKENSIYNKGLVWAGSGGSKYLVMRNEPDRLFCSESFDLGVDQGYFINNQAVLSANTLGNGVLYSSLVRLGVLQTLDVQGNAAFLGNVDASIGTVKASTLVFNDGTQSLSITNTGINSDKNVTLKVQNSDVFYADNDEITIGHKQNTRRPVKVFGPLAVGVNNPDPSVSLAVSGNISFANKKFMTGAEAPTSGLFLKGDICWNTDPKPNSYVGWVCVTEGTPGEWAPFGAITR